MMTMAPTDDSARVATWLAGALVVLPLLQALPLDFDRSAVLAVLLPVLWVGRHKLASAALSLGNSRRWIRAALLATGIAIILSVAFADQPAPAIVTAATWVLVAAAGLIAGAAANGREAAIRRILEGVALGSALALAIMGCLWLATGRGAVPLYAHHRHVGLHAIGGALAGSALLVTSQRWPQRCCWLAAGGVSWAGLLWSGGRTPMVALTVGIAVWFGISAGLRKKIALATALHLGLGLAVSSSFVSSRPELGWRHAVSRTAAAVQPASVNVSKLTSTRSDFWREAAEHALKSPWIGHGPDAYRHILPKLDGQQPHNLLLQLWLDLGIAGALPLLGGLGCALVLGWRQARAHPDNRAYGAAFALAMAFTAASMLDGVYYHVLTLLPAMLVLGILLFGHPSGLADINGPRRTAAIPIARTLVSVAAAVLVIHSWLFQQLAVASPPRGPDAAAARLIRVFPSTTFGLWHWLDAWYRDDPATAIAWARWAQGHAANPSLFHIRAGQYLLASGDPDAAREELRAARDAAHWTARPAIAEFEKKLFSSP